LNVCVIVFINDVAAAGLNADSLLIIFTLAALPPKDQHNMLSNAYKVSTLQLQL